MINGWTEGGAGRLAMHARRPARKRTLDMDEGEMEGRGRERENGKVKTEEGKEEKETTGGRGKGKAKPRLEGYVEREEQKVFRGMCKERVVSRGRV